MDYPRRFGGISRLYGPAALTALAGARVGVVGVGGVGSWAVEALARSGVGHLTLIDLDQVAESNINRQIQALDGTLGQAKVTALAERIAGINPDAQVRCIEEFAEPDNLERVIDPSLDYLLDCIDGAHNKAALIAHCQHIGLPLVTVGGAGGTRDPTRLRVLDLAFTSQDPLLARTRQLLRARHGFPRDPKRPFRVACVFSDQPRIQPVAPGCDGAPGGRLNCAGYGSVVTVTAAFGLAAAAQVLERLASGPA